MFCTNPKRLCFYINYRSMISSNYRIIIRLLMKNHQIGRQQVILSSSGIILFYSENFLNLIQQFLPRALHPIYLKIFIINFIII